MDLQLVVADLEKRIAAGKDWLSSGESLEFAGPPLRNSPTLVQLTSFLDSPRRVERYGLGFIVTVDGPRGPRKFQLNVRVKPTFTDGRKTDSYPYVVSYVVDQIRRADDEIEHEHFVEPARYVALSRLCVQDWYKNWVDRALRTGSGKFFAREVLIE
jgi:hypothetical protein